VDRLGVGRSIRAIRIRLGWRQSDLSKRAGVSRSFVSKVERGLIRHSDLDRLERVCAELGAELDVRIRWRGEGLDRLLDEAHAALVDRVVTVLKATGWVAAVAGGHRRCLACWSWQTRRSIDAESNDSGTSLVWRYPCGVTTPDDGFAIRPTASPACRSSRILLPVALGA
jgi:transcriptional regulator with XRE-family HTH domain